MTEAEVIQKAIGILYDMNEFITEVEDSEYWLTYGVPDGTFSEATREEAEANFSIHDHLVVSIMSTEEVTKRSEDKVYRYSSKHPATFDPSDLEEFGSAFIAATDSPVYSDMADRRNEIIEEAKSLLNTYISTGG